MIKSWIAEQIKKTKTYQVLSQDIIDRANLKWDEFFDRANEYHNYVASVSEDNLEIGRLLREQVCIASDVHFNSNSLVIVLSKIGGGHVRFIDVDIKSFSELNDIIKRLQNIFRVSEDRVLIDMPFGYRRM